MSTDFERIDWSEIRDMVRAPAYFERIGVSSYSPEQRTKALNAERLPEAEIQRLNAERRRNGGDML